MSLMRYHQSIFTGVVTDKSNSDFVIITGDTTSPYKTSEHIYIQVQLASRAAGVDPKDITNVINIGDLVSVRGNIAVPDIGKPVLTAQAIRRIASNEAIVISNFVSFGAHFDVIQFDGKKVFAGISERNPMPLVDITDLDENLKRIIISGRENRDVIIGLSCSLCVGRNWRQDIDNVAYVSVEPSGRNFTNQCGIYAWNGRQFDEYETRDGKLNFTAMNYLNSPTVIPQLCIPGINLTNKSLLRIAADKSIDTPNARENYNGR